MAGFARDILGAPGRVTPVAPRASATGLEALHDAMAPAARQIADALQRVLPRGFRGRLTVVVDNGVVRAQDVAIELRPAQLKP